MDRHCRFHVVTVICLSWASTLLAQEFTFRRGDADASGGVNITDAVFILDFLFRGARVPSCMDAADSNDDGAVDLSDPVRILHTLFAGEPPLQMPSDSCLPDATADDLPECSYPPCCGAGQPRVPVLFGGELGDTLRPGTVITLYGINFPQESNESQVLFTSGAFRIAGFITEVRVASQPPPCTLKPSQMDVVVPTGFSSGDIELIASGHSAGVIRAGSAPQMYAATLGFAEDWECVWHPGTIDFEEFLSRINLYGFGFDAIQEIRLEDSLGNIQRVPPSMLLHNPALRCTAESNYEALSFNLHLRLAFPSMRDNVCITVGSGQGTSNRFEVPVCNTLDVNVPVLGAVIDAVRVPLGVTTDSVAIDYRCYDSSAESTWTMEFEWTADSGENWFEALAKRNDPEHDDTSGVQCASVRFFDDNCQLPAGGTSRRFVWDAKNDPNFRAVNEGRTEDPGVPRPWTVRFRIRPVSQMGDVDSGNHIVESPDIAYVDMDEGP